MLIKYLSIFNWFCIGLLALLVLVLLLDPQRNGGDAATKGIGGGLITIAVVSIAVILAMNLSPWTWTRYLPMALILLISMYILTHIEIAKLQSAQHKKELLNQPYFEEPELDLLARSIVANDKTELKRLLETQRLDSTKLFPVLWFAISNVPEIKDSESRLQCIHLLTEAGADLNKCATDPDILAGPSDKGNPVLLRFLFEHGADPNSSYYATGCPFIFQAIHSTMDPMGSVLCFLEFGANPNIESKCYTDDVQTPLLYAAVQSHWNICIALIENGANATYQSPKGASCAKYVAERLKYIEEYKDEKAILEKLQVLLK